MIQVTPLERMLFLGLGGHAVALDRETGEELWRTKLPRSGYGLVSLVLDGDLLIAGGEGHVAALEPFTGEIIWTNPLRQLGFGSIAMATARVPGPQASQPLAAAREARDRT